MKIKIVYPIWVEIGYYVSAICIFLLLLIPAYLLSKYIFLYYFIYGLFISTCFVKGYFNYKYGLMGSKIIVKLVFLTGLIIILSLTFFHEYIEKPRLKTLIERKNLK